MGNNIRKLKKEDIAKYYDIKHKLGTGSFAIVKLAVRKSDGKQFAIKIIKKTKLNAEELAVVHDEAEIMQRIDHPNCVKLYEMFETSKKLYMVLELLTGGELFDRIVAKGSYSEKEASAVTKDIASALKYLHSVNVVHRDLKPENLLYSSSNDSAVIKITDFGLAKYRVAGETMNTACGTPGYVAPEVLKNEPYDKSVDMWSLGVILYILLCGFPPFYHENTQQLYKQIKKGEFDFPDPYWKEISSEAKNLVTCLLTVNAKKRMTAEGVLNHPWITGTISDKTFHASHTDRLRQLQARRKLRRGVQMVLAVNKLSSLFRKPIGGSSSSTSSANGSGTTSSASATASRSRQKANDSDDD